MEVLKKEKRLCSCCMQEHEVLIVREEEHNIYKNIPVTYQAVYEYCDLADEYQATGEMISQNDAAMKEAYRGKVRLLTAEQIRNIRKKYSISQRDLAELLGWGGKTVTRYESHQVQDVAHDMILRKIDSDPEWFLTILESSKRQISLNAYLKYYNMAVAAFEDSQDMYLRKAIMAQYSKYEQDEGACGGCKLDINKIIDVIRYFANSIKVDNLYKVKLMKMIWYADNLCYKRKGHSMMGLVYKALPMGAVPIAHQHIIELKGIVYEEIDYGDYTGLLFKGDDSNRYDFLTDADKDILDAVIEMCGKDNKAQIVNRMHRETAFKKTGQGEIISYHHALALAVQ